MIRVRGLFQKQLKNRSSKNLKWLTGPGTKSIMRCVSNEQLNKWAIQEVNGAEAEIQRRKNLKNKNNNTTTNNQ